MSFLLSGEDAILHNEKTCNTKYYLMTHSQAHVHCNNEQPKGFSQKKKKPWPFLLHVSDWSQTTWSND